MIAQKLTSHNIKTRNIFKILAATLVILICAASVQAGDQNLKFAVISDIQKSAMPIAIRFIKSQKVDFILIAGDFYNSQKGYYAWFSDYGYRVDPHKNQDDQGVYFAIGNHDEPPAGDDFFRFFISKAYPQNGPAGAPEGTIYSFNRGNCHFVVTNPYLDQCKGDYTQSQLDWIERDLSQSSRKFKFVVGHEPAFPQKRHIGNSLDENPKNRDAFWKIVSDNGAQAFFCGHTHHISHLLYQGVYQIDDGKVEEERLCVTIVEVDSEKAAVRAYKTRGAMPEAEKVPSDPGNMVHQTIIYARPEKTNDEIQVLYSAASEAEQLGKNCFIDHMTDK